MTKWLKITAYSFVIQLLSRQKKSSMQLQISTLRGFENRLVILARCLNLQYAFFICGRSEKGVVCITWLICLAHLFTYLVRVQNSFRNIFYSKGWRKINKKEDFSCGRSFFKTYFKFCLISMLVPSDLMYGQKAVFSHFDQKMAKFGQNLVKIWSFLKFQN